MVKMRGFLSLSLYQNIDAISIYPNEVYICTLWNYVSPKAIESIKSISLKLADLAD